MNYTQLVQAIKDYTESTETSFVSHIDEFIKQAEKKIYNEVQLPYLRKNVTGNATGLSGTPNISAGTIAGSTGTFTGDVDIADKIVHTGDTDTTIRFPSADTIRFDTGGTEAARINSAQKLIIGDTNSDAQLGVYRASYNLAEFTNTNADATGAEVALRKDSSSPADGDVLGMLKFIGDNDAGEKVNYAYIQSKSSDVSDGTEDGCIGRCYCCASRPCAYRA